MKQREYMTVRRAVEELFPCGAHAVIDRLDDLALNPGELADTLGGMETARLLLSRFAAAMHGISWSVGTGRLSDACVSMALRDAGARLRFDCAAALVQDGVKVMGDVPYRMNELWNHTSDLPGRSLTERGISVAPAGLLNGCGAEVRA